jgi:hypothetical protein
MMKKLFFIVTIAFFLLSCGEKEFYSILITNNSSKTVSYIYNNIIDTLAVSESKNYEIKDPYTPSPKNITDQNGIESITMKQSAGYYTFLDTTPLELSVTNSLPITVKIKADNYIDDDGSTEFSIGGNSEKTTAKIYTSNPKFTSLVDYPVIIGWNKSGNTVYVIIR